METTSYEHIKRANAEIVNNFEVWTRTKDWNMFHDSHYDWFAYPIDRSSVGKGDEFKLTSGIIEQLLKDSEFVLTYRKGISLGLLAWGWSISTGPIEKPDPSQKWSNWTVRLYKMGLSSIVFKQKDLFLSIQSFAKHLITTITPNQSIQRAISRWEGDRKEHNFEI